jgi:transposase-like protein
MGDRGEQFKGRQFTAQVILWAVRWYLQFPISYRDLELRYRQGIVESGWSRIHHVRPIPYVV